MSNFRLAVKQLISPGYWDRRHGIGRLSGPSRYLLIRLVSRMGRGDRELVQEELSKELGMTKLAISEAVAQLVGGRFLLPVRKVSSGRGRPRSVYQIGPHYLEALEALPVPLGFEVFEGLLETIIEGPFGGGKSSSSGLVSLKPLNRLLLAALLLRADERGLAFNISVAELERVCGLKGEQFKSQMSKLGDLGYIRRHVSGLSGKTLFGRARGMVFLNVGHPDYGSMGQVQYVLTSKTFRGAEPPKDVWDLLESTSAMARTMSRGEAAAKSVLAVDQVARYRSDWGFDRFSDLWEGDPEFQLPPYFSTEGWDPKPLAMLISAHVCDRASRVVSRAWGGKRDVDAWERVEKTLMTSGDGERHYWENLLRVGDGPVPDRAMVSAMLALTEDLAVRVMRVLEEVERIGRLTLGARILVTIIPPPYLRDGAGDLDRLQARARLTVVAMPEDSMAQGEHRCFTLEYESDPTGRPNRVMRPYVDEQDIDLQERRAAGLVLIPKRYPSAGKG